MKFEGEVAEVEVIPMLVDLGREKFTGALRFENDTVIKIIYFKVGDILSASTNDRADSLDEILLRGGKVNREHVKQALAKRKDSESLGDALLGLGFITRKELTWARRVQIVGIIRSIMNWDTGSFTLVQDYLPKREEGTVFFLPQIIVELLVTEQDRSRIEREMDGGSAVLAKTSEFEKSYPLLALNEDADAIAAKVDGRRSASEIASYSSSDPFTVYKLLYAFRLLGLMSTADKPQVVDETFSSDFPVPMGTIDLPLEELGGFANSGEHEISDRTQVIPLPPDLIPPPDPPTARFEPAWEAEEYSETPQQSSVPLPDSGEPYLAPSLEMEELDDFEPADSAGEEPKFAPIPIAGKKSTPSQYPSSGKTRSRTPLLLAVVFVAIAGAAGFFYWRSRQGVVPAAASSSASSQAPRPRPAAQSATPAGGGTALPSTSDVVPIPAPGTVQGSTAGEAGLPATSTSMAEAGNLTTTTGPGRVTSPPPATTSLAPAVRPVPRPLPPPVAAVEPRPTAGPASAPSLPASQLRQKYDAMAVSNLDKGRAPNYTIQLELVCRTESVTRAIDAGGSSVWFVPQTYKGEQCFKVFWGRYADRGQAEQGVASIPKLLRSSGPVVVRFGGAAR